jgi:hypothetical protein
MISPRAGRKIKNALYTMNTEAIKAAQSSAFSNPFPKINVSEMPMNAIPEEMASLL